MSDRDTIAKYGVDCGEFDFGTLNARNQLIKKIVNPGLDMLLYEPVHNHIIDSKTVYRLKLFLVAETPNAVQ